MYKGNSYVDESQISGVSLVAWNDCYFYLFLRSLEPVSSMHAAYSGYLKRGGELVHDYMKNDLKVLYLAAAIPQ